MRFSLNNNFANESIIEFHNAVVIHVLISCCTEHIVLHIASVSECLHYIQTITGDQYRKKILKYIRNIKVLTLTLTWIRI